MVHLRSYTHYSAWESILRIPDLVQKAVDNNHGSLAITDAGNMYGAIEFYRACKKAGINPIIGQEFSLVENASNRERSKSYKIALLARNLFGYKNLMKLSTKGFQNFYYVPRIDADILAEHSEGLVCLVWDHIEKNSGFNQDEMKRDLDILDFAMDKQVLFEVRADGTSGSINRFISDNFDNDRIVPTVPMRFAGVEDFKTHDMAYSIQANFTGRRKKQLPTQMYYYPTDREMLDRLSALNASRLMQNTDYFANSVSLEIPTDFKFPKFRGMEEEEASQYIEGVAAFNLIDKVDSAVYQQYLDRLKYELGVVKKLGFCNYFLVVADIVEKAKQMDVEVGPGRGSVCGSVLAWVLGIHSIDPIKHGLFFERFLNEDRVSMPDIDIDFDDMNRDKVIRYIADEYGHDKVAQICTHSTLAMRGAIKDVARAMGIGFETANLYSKTVPFKYEKKELREYPEVAQMIHEDETFGKVLDFAEKLEGQFRQPSVHAAAVVIAPDDITDFTPLQSIKDREATQFEMRGLEYGGLVKMDVLGLRTLSVLKNSIESAATKENTEKQIRESLEGFNDESTSDKATLDLIKRGDTSGVFQIEEGGMSALAKEIRVSDFGDVAALVALYRPALIAGGLDRIYIENKERKQSGEELESIHPIVSHTFDETYGVPLYQESLMKLAQVMGGFSLKEADTLRKAVGKKDMALLESLRAKFEEGAKQKGVGEEDIVRIWHDVFEAAGDYGFNKSHAVAYGSISYKTAYMKKHYALDFYSALLTSVQQESKKPQFQKYLSDIQKHNIHVVLPNINTSEINVTHDGVNILLGLGCIKTIGEGFAGKIVESRKSDGEFKDIIDFVKRTEPDITQLAYLIYAQAIDNGFAYLNETERLIKHCKRLNAEKDKISGGGFNFGVEESEFALQNPSRPSDNEIEGYLFESIGFRGDFAFEEEIIYTTKTKIKTYKQWTAKKSGNEMAMIVVDSYPAHQMLVFPRTFDKVKGLLIKNKELVIDFKWLEDMKLVLEDVREP